MVDTAKVVGVGELVWDCFADARRPGGAPANVAFHANQLGMSGHVLSRVGRDELGDELIRYLNARGVETRCIQRDDSHPTGRVTVDVTDGVDPTYLIHEEVAWDFLAFDTSWSDVLADSAVVCFGTLAQRSAASREAIERCLSAASGALFVYDVNFRPPFVKRAWVEAAISKSNVVKMNIGEVAEVSALLGMSTHNVEQFARLIIGTYAVDAVFVTRGCRGCFAVSGNETADVAGHPVAVIDAVGAGDAFTAAMMRGLLEQWPLRVIAEFANRVGALVAAHAGAMPLLHEDLDALDAEIWKHEFGSG